MDEEIRPLTQAELKKKTMKVVPVNVLRLRAKFKVNLDVNSINS